MTLTARESVICYIGYLFGQNQSIEETIRQVKIMIDILKFPRSEVITIFGELSEMADGLMKAVDMMKREYDNRN